MQKEQPTEPLTLFYSYAHEDELLREQLEKHLRLLSRQGFLSEWHDRQIVAGTEWAQEIDAHLETASMILLLISSDFLNSDYYYDIEMQRALERHKRGEACVIPIILRPCDWHKAPFAHIQVLPHDGKPVTEWANLDAAFLDITHGIRRAIERQTSSVRPPLPLSPVDQLYRQRLLKRVRQTWIEGGLEQSLHQATLIALDLQERPDALDDPWYLEAQETNRPPRPLPAGTPIVQVYGEADGELLILGEPGAGKTTLLLELARTLLERAEQERIPVVFNLSSWAQRRQPLAVWLVEELWEKYRIPLKVGQAWIASGQILPLLDGLDEVAENARPVCAQAINTYHQDCMERGPAPLVVCCRSQEYLTLSTRVTLQQAVSIQPLTDEQIECYLQSAGDQLEGLQQALRTNRELYKLAQCPLMLSIFTLAYQGVAPEDIPTEGTQEALQRQAFASYVQRMLTRHSVQSLYSQKDIQQWLAWLAKQMQQRRRTEFYLEQLQPTWLPTKRLQQIYTLLNGLVVVLGVELSLGLFYGLLIGQPIGLLIGLACGLFSILPIVLSKRLQKIRTVLPNKHFVGHSRREGIYHIEVPRSRMSGWLMLLGLMLQGAGLAARLSEGGFTGSLFGEVTRLFMMLFIWLFLSRWNVTLTRRLNRELSKSESNKDQRRKPNQYIRLSGWVALGYGPLYGLLCGLVFVLAFGPDLGYGLLCGLVLVPPIVLRLGGFAYLQHYILRFLLLRAGVLPWHYIRFLDYAAERTLLREVDGGYIFIHRLLLDYFASLEIPWIIEPQPIPARPFSSVERQNRMRLMRRVRTIWIGGVLEHPLHQATRFELHLQERPDALVNPRRLQIQELDCPPSTSIVQVYGEADGELLILGEPGAGKTTLLLELARTLLERAEQEEQEGIPVVFNLSSWVKKRQPLAAWLVAELWMKYQVPRKMGRAWIASGQILPLLDGLDEVTENARLACAQAINTYHQDCMERGPAPLVVCCRSQEYLTLSTRVTLQQAVSIQPLTDEQIECYLQSAGDQLEGLQQALRTNRELYKLAQCPLMLSIFTLAYQGVAPEDIPTEGTQEALQRQAFASYVQRMFTHWGVSKHASHEQMLQWLTFLATRMKQKQQMTFYLEHLQPDWQVGWWRHLFYRLSTGLFVWLVSMLAVGPGLVLTPELSAGGLGLGLGLGLFISLHRRIQPQEILAWSWKEAKRNIVVLVGVLVAALLALLIGVLVAALIGGLIGGLIGDLVAGLIVGLASILVGSLISRLIGRFPTKQIDDCMSFTPNQGIWLSGRSGLVMGLIGGLSFWLLALLVLAPSSMAIDVVDALLAFLPIGLLVGLMCGMDAFFQHFTLRFWLWRTDQLPWNLVSFLDEATNRLLLYKIGGGYTFIHRLLLDYFADLEKKGS